MISTYSEYIRRYSPRYRTSDYPSPGEHHFVAAYLVPRLIEKFNLVPDYINPDGAKSVLGDIVYYRDKSHHFSIEVKSDEVRFTPREFNNWIVEAKHSLWPDVFIGVCGSGLICCAWQKFRDGYISSVKRSKNDSAWTPVKVLTGYGPTMRLHLLANGRFPGVNWFPLQESDLAEEWEEAFLLCLARLASKLISIDHARPEGRHEDLAEPEPMRG